LIQEAHNAYNAQDYERAFGIYEELANSGNVEAQTSLGFLYQNAIGVDKDEKKACKLYESASKTKYPMACYNLSLIYKDGIDGIEPNQFRAHELMLDAAIGEIPQAMFEVALMLESGLGCVQNYSEAAFWYEEAAKRAHVEAFNNLGVLYKDALGVEQSFERALICFQRASEASLPEAQYNLGLMYDQGLGVEVDNDKALELCRKAAYNGHEKAKKIIASLQESGQIVW
jgi:TPR repeat protein